MYFILINLRVTHFRVPFAVEYSFDTRRQHPDSKAKKKKKKKTKLMEINKI